MIGEESPFPFYRQENIFLRVEECKCSWSGFHLAASVRFDVVLALLPAHRTGQALFAHPALGEGFTVWSTES
jgi:hypothetical protein